MNVKRILKLLLRLLIGNFDARTLRQIFAFCLNVRPEVWIPLARQSLYTIPAPDFGRDLTLDRFSQRDVEFLYSQLKNQLSDVQFFFVTDSSILLQKPEVQVISFDKNLPVVTPGKKPVFLCAFNSDEKMVRFLKKLQHMHGSVYFMPRISYPTARYFHRDEKAREVLLEERARSDSTKFELADYENILQAIAVTKNLPGPYVEIGVYRGDSARLALRYMRERRIKKDSYLIDTYEGFLYKEAGKSSDARWIESDRHDDAPMELVAKFLKEFPEGKLLKLNAISDELPEEIKEVSVCNIDVDMYEAVLASATKMASRMARGGIMILEDPGHTPAMGGAYLAAVEFLESDAGRAFIPVHLYSGQMFLIKVLE